MDYPLVDLFILIAWSLLIALLIGSTVICAIVSLWLSGKPKAIAIDVLLWLATISILGFQSAVFLPKSITHGKSSDLLRLSYVRKASLTSVDLMASTYLDRLDSPWRELAGLQQNNALQHTLENSEKLLNSIWKDHPDDAAVASRLAIIRHESKHPDLEKVFERFFETKDDPLMKFLQQVYSKGKIDPVLAIFSGEEIRKNLPEDWFRESVLKEYYKKTSASNLLLELNAGRERLGTSWLFKYKCLEIFTVLFAVAGAASIAAFCYFKPKEKLPEPDFYGFRKVYGCFLTYAFAQGIASMAVGFGIGFVAGLSQTPHEVPNFSGIANSVVVTTCVIAVSLAFKHFVCRPSGLPFWHALMKGSEKLSRGACITYALLGFCASVFISIVCRLLFTGIMSQGSVTDAVLQLMDAFISTNLAGLIWSFCWFCILGPFSEELLLRFLLYPWLRHKLGVATAIVLSSIIFAGIHFNLPFFFHYFAIGALLAIVYERTRNFPVIVAIHSLWNAWVIVLVTALIPS